jgi:exonuclease VII small subunit
MDIEEFKEFAEATRKALKYTENGLDELSYRTSESGETLSRSLEKLIKKLQDDLDDILDEYESDDDDDDDDDD